jgi:hypothetical protein
MEKYKNFLSKVGTALKRHGYQKKEEVFYVFKNGNWGLVDIQKSRSTAANSISFTINVGVCSTALRSIMGIGPTEDKPEIEDCHWRTRLGFLMPEKKDLWWSLEDGSTTDTAIAEISNLIEAFAVPAIENRISDDKLKETLLTGDAAGCTELQRYVYLTTLMKLTRDERLEATVADFLAAAQGKSWERSAKIHIHELESYA